MFYLLFLLFHPFLVFPYPLFLLMPMSSSAILSFPFRDPWFLFPPLFSLSLLIHYSSESYCIANVSSGEQD
jgi:hypothetical protein